MSIDILRASLGGRQVPRTPDSVTRGFASVTWWSTLEMRGLSPRPPLPSSPSPSPRGLCSLHIFLSSPSPPFSLSFPSLSNHRDQYNLMSKQESASLPLSLGSSFLLEGAQRVPPGYPGKASSGRETKRLRKQTDLNFRHADRRRGPGCATPPGPTVLPRAAVFISDSL